MMIILKISIFGSILIALINGVPIEYCSNEDDLIVYSAPEIYPRRKEREKYLELCAEAQNITIQCAVLEVFKGADLFSTVKTQCDTLNFISNEFSECTKELFDNVSTRFMDWKFHFFNKPKDSAQTKQQCKEVFGVEWSVKYDIIRLCGNYEWQIFRQFFVNLHEKHVKKCEFNEDKEPSYYEMMSTPVPWHVANAQNHLGYK